MSFKLQLLFGACLMVAVGCKRVDPEAEKRRLAALDSIRDATIADSLAYARLQRELETPLQILGPELVDIESDEYYRFIAQFSWGKSPAGPMLSVFARRAESDFPITTKSFRTAEGVVLMWSLDEADFQKLARTFDSVDFAHQPVFLDIDYTVYDASKYFIEYERNGKYHGIVRSDTVDQFVYHLFAEALTLAKFDQEMIKEFRRLAAKQP